MITGRGRLLPLGLALALGACDEAVSGDDPTDLYLRDLRPTLGDAARPDRGATDDFGRADATLPPDDEPFDADVMDGSATRDMLASRDMASAPIDAMPLDRALPREDMALPEDMAPLVDMAIPPDMGPDLPPGREACEQGPGWSLLRLSWDPGSNSARVDHWDVPCDYSIRINDACGVFDRCRGGVGCDVGRTNTGAVELDGSDDLLLRLSMNGLAVPAADFHLLGRSLCPASATEYDLVDPLGGFAVSGGPVGQQFEYQWHSVALPAFRAAGEQPMSVTAGQGCGRLGVQAIEICVR